MGATRGFEGMTEIEIELMRQEDEEGWTDEIRFKEYAGNLCKSLPDKLVEEVYDVNSLVGAVVNHFPGNNVTKDGLINLYNKLVEVLNVIPEEDISKCKTANELGWACFKYNVIMAI